MKDAEIRPLAAADLPALAALHAAAFPAEPWDAKSLGRFAALPGALSLVAGRPPAGLLMCSTVGAEAEVLTLAVAPAQRRRGLASRLLQDATSRLVALGCQRLILEVAEDNSAAKALYARLGFAEIGRRKAYYRRAETAAGGAKGVDALILALAFE